MWPDSRLKRLAVFSNDPVAREPCVNIITMMQFQKEDKSNPIKLKAMNEKSDARSKPGDRKGEDSVAMIEEVGMKRKHDEFKQERGTKRTKLAGLEDSKKLPDPEPSETKVKRKRKKSMPESSVKRNMSKKKNLKLLSSTAVPKGDYQNGLKGEWHFLNSFFFDVPLNTQSSCCRCET